MTTETIQGLIAKNQSGGKTYYEPTIRQCKGGSKFNDKKEPEKRQFFFSELDGYWNIGNNEVPVVGEWYALELSSKPGDTGMWRDIIKIELVDGPPASDGMIPRSSPTVYKDEEGVEFPPDDQDDAERSMNEDFTPRGTATQPALTDAINLMAATARMNSEADKQFTGKPDQSQRPNAGIKVEGVVQGHLEKLAVDLYVFGGAHYPGEVIDYLRIREIRDAFFHQVKEKPIQPEHYCYEHSAQMNKGNTGYGHKVEDGWCIENAGIVMDEGK